MHGIQIRTDIIVENMSCFLNKQYSGKVSYMADGFRGKGKKGIVREGFRRASLLGNGEKLVAWDELTQAFRAL